MQNKERNTRLLTGLLLGFALGCGVNYLLLWLYNLFTQWNDMEPVAITFWRLLPLGVVMALALAAILRTPPVSD